MPVLIRKLNTLMLHLIMAAVLPAVIAAAVAGEAEAAPGTSGGEEKANESAEERPGADGEDESGVSVRVGEEGASVFAVNADAHEVFSRVGEATGLALVVDDTVKGQMTVNIVNKEAREMVELLVDAYGLSFSEVGNVYVVSEGVPKAPSSYLLSDIEAITTKYVKPTRARSLLPQFLQSHVTVSTDQNAVVLSAPQAVLDKFREDVRQFDIPAKQIMLDVLVVEYTDVDTETFASNLGYQNANFGLTTDSLTGESVLTAVTELSQDFFMYLDALVGHRKARVRANPRVATVSGQYATVFIGKKRYLGKPIQMPGQYGQTNAIEAGVRLQMRPLTGGKGEIILWLQQEISTLSALDPTTGLPERTKRTAQTTVRVRDGQTVVIGGLRQKESRTKHSGIPIVSEIPLIGELFKSKKVEKTDVELAVFITARILDETGHLPAAEEERLRERFLQRESDVSRPSADAGRHD